VGNEEIVGVLQKGVPVTVLGDFGDEVFGIGDQILRISTITVSKSMSE
jgi:hypothetical protein